MSSLSTVLTRIGVAVVLAALCAGGAVAQPRELMQADALNEELIQTYSEGRYTDALPLAKRVLAIREKVLGPKHPDVATSLHNLAEVYRSQGRYSDAEPLYKRSLAIRRRHLAPSTPPSLSLSTTWPCYMRTRVAMPRLSRSISVA
jgi:tetratricopeptide (TPR) repeat protein